MVFFSCPQLLTINVNSTNSIMCNEDKPFLVFERLLIMRKQNTLMELVQNPNMVFIEKNIHDTLTLFSQLNHHVFLNTIH